MSNQTRTQPIGQTFPPLAGLLRKRRRGLSLKMLMLAVLVIGGVLGWVVHEARVQRDAVAAIRKAGGRVAYDWQFNLKTTPSGQPGWLQRNTGPDFFDAVTAVHLGSGWDPRPSASVDDALMAQIGRLTRLQKLEFNSTKVTGAGLAALRNLQDLRYLDLTTSGLDTVDLSDLNRLESLSLRCDSTRQIDLNFLRDLPALRDLTLFEVGQQPDLRPLAKLKHLRRLRLMLPVSSLAPLHGMPNLMALNLDGSQLAGLAQLQPLLDLRSLYVSAGRIRTVAPLTVLSKLHTLSLPSQQLGDNGLAPIRTMQSLRRLGLSGNHITNEGLVDVGQLTGLIELDLSDTWITDEGLEHLQTLSALQELSLADTLITDQALPALTGHSALRELSLDQTRITDAGLSTLAGLTNLEKLSLRQTAITDAGLLQLASLTRCRVLFVHGTKVTPAGVKALQTKCPTMVISR